MDSGTPWGKAKEPFPGNCISIPAFHVNLKCSLTSVEVLSVQKGRTIVCLLGLRALFLENTATFLRHLRYLNMQTVECQWVSSTRTLLNLFVGIYLHPYVPSTFKICTAELTCAGCSALSTAFCSYFRHTVIPTEAMLIWSTSTYLVVCWTGALETVLLRDLGSSYGINL